MPAQRTRGAALTYLEPRTIRHEFGTCAEAEHDFQLYRVQFESQLSERLVVRRVGTTGCGVSCQRSIVPVDRPMDLPLIARQPCRGRPSIAFATPFNLSKSSIAEREYPVPSPSASSMLQSDST